MRFDRSGLRQGYTVRASLGTAVWIPRLLGFFLAVRNSGQRLYCSEDPWQGPIGSIKFDEIAGLLAAERNNVGRVLVNAEKS
jgi:hypothetical protein